MPLDLVKIGPTSGLELRHAHNVIHRLKPKDGGLEVREARSFSSYHFTCSVTLAIASVK
jgi:hypothetical protein